jgi:DNA-directed RNA polymerase specialized sigma24 family protein
MSKFQLPDEGAQRWLRNYANKNFWRVASWMDYDDLVQDGYMCYADTIRRYPNTQTREHTMSLFKLVFRSHIEDLVRKSRKQVLDEARSDIVEIVDNYTYSPDNSDFNAMILKAPKVVRDAVLLFLDDSTLEQLRQPYRRDDLGRRETLNDRICKLLNKPNSLNLVALLRQHFAD